MEHFEFYNISERYIELINPMTPEKIIKLGRLLRLKEGTKVIEFGSGYGEILALWGENFGISGIGIDIREHVCNRAKEKIKKKGLEDRIEIVYDHGAEYPFEKGAFDVAACIGASFIWEGYRPTIFAMKEAIHKDGKLVIGEPYWRTANVPTEWEEKEKGVHLEFELLEIAREEGFDFEYVVRSSQDDWDGYEACNWYGLIQWIEENPDHPEKQEVIDYLHKLQDDYLMYNREYLGWAIYILNPIKY